MLSTRSGSNLCLHHVCEAHVALICTRRHGHADKKGNQRVTASPHACAPTTQPTDFSVSCVCCVSTVDFSLLYFKADSLQQQFGNPTKQNHFKLVKNRQSKYFFPCPSTNLSCHYTARVFA